MKQCITPPSGGVMLFIMLQFIHIFGQKIPLFNVMLAFGLLSIAIGVLTQVKKNHWENIETKLLMAIPTSGLIGAFFAFLFDGIFRYGICSKWDFRQAGITFYGWLFGCILAFYLYSLTVKIKFTFLLNIFLPLFALAQAFGRIGCFSGGCCYGKPCTYGIAFPAGSIPYQQYADLPLIPVQLFEALFLLTLFWILEKKVQFGFRAPTYLITASTARFCFEFMRGDNRGNFLFISSLSPAQCFGFFFFLFGIILLFCSRKKIQPNHLKS